MDASWPLKLAVQALCNIAHLLPICDPQQKLENIISQTDIIKSFFLFFSFHCFSLSIQKPVYSHIYRLFATDLFARIHLRILGRGQTKL
jgi:hypothetical protein